MGKGALRPSPGHGYFMNSLWLGVWLGVGAMEQVSLYPSNRLRITKSHSGIFTSCTGAQIPSSVLDHDCERLKGERTKRQSQVLETPAVTHRQQGWKRVQRCGDSLAAPGRVNRVPPCMYTQEHPKQCPNKHYHLNVQSSVTRNSHREETPMFCRCC